MFTIHVPLALKNSRSYILEEFMNGFEWSHLTNLLSGPILGCHVLKNVNVLKRNSNMPSDCQLSNYFYKVYM